MSTKLDAVELSEERFPTHISVAEALLYNPGVEMAPRRIAVECYAAAIREEALPIAEERDELLEVVKLFLKEYKDVELHTPIAYYKVVDAAEKVIAKYPKG